MPRCISQLNFQSVKFNEEIRMKTGEQEKIKVVVIENNRFILNRWEMILNELNGYEVSALYSDYGEGIRGNEITKADIVLLDLNLPSISGVEGVKYLKANFPGQIQISTIAHDDDKNIFLAIIAGAVSFIPKDISPSEFEKSMIEIIKGGSQMTPNIARNIISILQKTSEYYEKVIGSLTDDDWKLLFNISFGKSYITIAEEMGESLISVLKRIRNVYDRIFIDLNDEQKLLIPDKIF